jgi:1-acyl-sn-glycerol-3-phosphate acyltransferase
MVEPLIGRDRLVEAIAAFLDNREGRVLERIRGRLEREIDSAGPEALTSFNERLAGAGADWSYYARDPLAQRLHHILAEQLLEREPEVSGLEHVAAVAARPVIALANHLSYSDANILEILLHRNGCSALADRLTVIAGPKVYSSMKRRFSSLCFGTIKVPQSSERSSEEAVMNTREVAIAARRVIEIAHERLQLGEALLIFPEGSRSRSGAMQPLLQGVSRYLPLSNASILPIGIAGTEAMFPIGDERIHVVPIGMRIGAPIDVAALRRLTHSSRRLMMDVAGLAIARLLTSERRGVYADDAPGLSEARSVLAAISGS